eukprot:8219369-Heterocapsa_arctica.AAC.1
MELPAGWNPAASPDWSVHPALLPTGSSCRACPRLHSPCLSGSPGALSSSCCLPRSSHLLWAPP